MAIPLYSANFNLNVGFANHVIVLNAGNYTIDAITIGVSQITAVAAGSFSLVAILENSIFSIVYATFPVAGIAPAGLVTPVNAVLSLTPNVVCERGDSLVFYLANVLNSANGVGSINLYGRTLL